jgi:DNA polymerase-3 subunit epsilon
MNSSLEDFAAALEQSGNYRVLKRLMPRNRYNDDAEDKKFIGLVVDTETTGLDPVQNEVIELGMIKFEYGQSGRIYRVLETFNQLQEPNQPIPDEITKLTGITNDDVADQRIDEEAVRRMVGDVALVIAHNAQFDRPMCERRWPVFAERSWACSAIQIPWRPEGHEGVKLAYLLTDYGFFHDGHRAADDCFAVLTLLALPLQMSGKLALTALLDTARKPIVRLWAVGSPFESKDILKSRKYRWSASRRCWYTDIEEAKLADEQIFLAQRIFGGDVTHLPVDLITARDRFSERASPD